MPLSALPGRHGIGDLGESAYHFIDDIKKCGFKIWQILPLNPLGYGNSPYQPYSSFAGDPIYINLDILVEQGLLEKVIDFHSLDSSVEYEEVRLFKEIYLKKAFYNFKPDENYNKFVKSAFWLNDYAEFIAKKRENDDKAWIEWNSSKLYDDLQKSIRFNCFKQYVFYRQWQRVKCYANDNGIQMMGDMPFYVGIDSADVFYNRDSFLLDETGHPTCVAGVPPDYFSEDGQLWGNPIYDWNHLKMNGYKLWVERLKWNSLLFDIIRIDHFRAFDTYWKVPAGEKTAKNGEWVLGPAYDFFDYIFKKLPDIDLIAEDLGDLRPEVHVLKDHYKLLGMKIVQFSFGDEEKEKHYQMPEYSIVYTGTHDNQPLKGWYHDLDGNEKKRIKNILMKLNCKGHDTIEKLLDYTLKCDSRIAILPMQDILKLGNDTRFNTPSTIGYPNWCWKLSNFNEFERYLNKIKDHLNNTKRI